MEDVMLKPCLDVIKTLMSFDTTSAKPNQALIDYVIAYIEQYDIEYQLAPSADGHKTNLIAYIGAKDAPAYIISGHTDVVPADENQWTVTAPFEPLILNDRLYGRGSADMKAFIGVALTLLAPLNRQPLNHAFILALSFDEEVGCLGAPLMIPDIARQKDRVKGCIIGEPTNMRVGYAHKGHLAARATIHGVGGHSGYPELGANAIDVAAEVIRYMRTLALDIRHEEWLDTRFTPPYSTLHTGLIAGGNALNKIPDKVTIDFEIRSLPGHQPEKLLEQIEHYFANGLPDDIREVAQRCQLSLECCSRYPQLNETNQDFIRFVAELAGDDQPPVALGFGSEAGLFAELGIPTVVCGPGSIHQAHLPDEYIEMEQIERSIGFFDNLLQQLAIRHQQPQAEKV